MRCTNWVATKQTKTRSVVFFICAGKWDENEAALAFEEVKNRTKYPLVELGRCQGHILVRITAENEPVFGGTEARLEVHFTCAKCRTEVVDDRLPDEYNLNQWATEIMKTWEPE